MIWGEVKSVSDTEITIAVGTKKEMGQPGGDSQNQVPEKPEVKMEIPMPVKPEKSEGDSENNDGQSGDSQNEAPQDGGVLGQWTGELLPKKNGGKGTFHAGSYR